MDWKNQIVKLIQQEQWPQTAIIDCDNLELLQTTSQQIIQVLTCLKHSVPSDQCSFCRRFNHGTLTNIFKLKASDQQLKKDNLKAIMQQLSFFSLEAKIPKILTIELGENLNLSCANSLLKFLEEPPQNTFIIILSQNYSEVLGTIRSRCQRFHLPTIAENDTNSLLEKIIKTRDQKDFLNLCYQWSNLEKTQLISDLKTVYKNLIIKHYPQLAIATLSLIDDLKKWSFDRLAITNYLIILEKIIRNPHENL